MKCPLWMLLFGAARLALAQYAGPALLTRGEAPASAAQPTIEFRPFVEVTGIYDTGLAAFTVTDTGALANTSSAGERVAFGISGTHRWAHTNFGATYRGSISHFAKQTYYDGMSQSLLLGLKHEFTRHISLDLSENAGTFSRDFGLLGVPQTSLFDPSTTYTPTTDYFDNRTYYFSSTADLIIKRSNRLSFALGGTAIANRRRSKALHGDTGINAGGDVQYRVSKRSTVGANYTYSHFVFTDTIGATDVHTVAGTYAIALARNVEFSGYAGLSRIENKNISTTTLDPVIAALLGITQSTQILHSIERTPAFGGRVAWRVPRAVVHASVRRGFSPGNGLFAASTSLAISGGYSYTGLRRWSASVQGSFDDNRALVGITGRYRSSSSGISLSRKLLGSTHFVASYSIRVYDSSDFSNYHRIVNEASIGFGFTPGEIPLRVW